MTSRLASDTVAYAAAMLTERALGFVLLPVLTRSLSPAEYGIWTQTFVISSVLMPLVVFSLPAAMVRFFSAGTSSAARRRWTLRALAWMGLGFAALVVVATLAPAPLAEAAYGDAGAHPFVPVLLILVAADSLGDMAIGLLRSAFLARRAAALVLARGMLRFGAMLLALLLFGASFRSAFLATAALQALLAAGFVAWALGRAAPEATAREVGAVDGRAMLAFSAPLVVIAVLSSVNAFADRFVLAHLMGLGTVAVYAAASSLAGLASVAYTVLGFTLFPVLSKHWAEGNEREARAMSSNAVRVFLFLTLPFVACLAALVDWLLPLLATASYRVEPGTMLMLGLAVVGYGLYQIMLYLMLLAGRGVHAVWMVLGAAGLNALINVLLVPRLGMSAAAVAALLSNGALALAAYVAAASRFPWRSALRTAAISAVAAGAARLAAQAWPGPGWAGLIAAALLAAAIVAAADLASRRSMLQALFAAARAEA